MALRQDRKLALTSAIAAALLTATLAWQASAADTGGNGSSHPRTGATSASPDTGRGGDAERDAGAGSADAPGRGSHAGSDSAAGNGSPAGRGGSSAAGYWTPERMREARPAPMPVLDR
ncbi:hypothetical protein GPA10_03250 [Streptomyces sp. p1417]|uniref:Uncharacterized protein n=1 Tax=Streptomyces typhae TaxID=2681492 RepID=A0A6L6WNC4_9ACTN|nr:hypothetical protein [Streptomyces typhae]MVO83805.1 hypothetical protein [Streptomyces typhae]